MSSVVSIPAPMFRKLGLRESLEGFGGVQGCGMGYPRIYFYRSDLILRDERKFSRSLGLLAQACF